MATVSETAGMAETEIGIEVGKALADRLGLVQDNTLREWHAESAGKNVMVTMTTVKFMDEGEFNELFKVAQLRVDQKADERRARRAVR